MFLGGIMITEEWDKVLKDEYQKDYFKTLRNTIHEEYKLKTIFPKYDDLFTAFNVTAYENIKVVILGQDPYHGEGEAHGLSFSVQDGIKLPPSLKNIYKELYDDLNIVNPNTGNLLSWSKQGVLLLNAILTVEKDKPASHRNIGWEKFTDAVISKINEKQTPVVFILWGNFARSKKYLITNPKHLIIESPHPSPFSARNGFFGSKPFSKTNKYLSENGINPINWQL